MAGPACGKIWIGFGEAVADVVRCSVGHATENDNTAALRSLAGLTKVGMIVVQVCEVFEPVMSVISTEATNYISVPHSVAKGLRVVEVGQACTQADMLLYRGYRYRGY